MNKIIILGLALWLAVAADATNVKKCSKGPSPLSVDVHGCSEPPCDVFKGSTAVMDVHFLGTKNNIKKMTAKVRATAIGVTVPYDLPDDVANVCTNLLYGAFCPIDKSEDVVYKFNFYVDTYYPEIPVKVEVSLVDDAQDTIACFLVDIKVKKASNSLRLD